MKDVVKPFDWTYSTDYRGTVASRGQAQFQVKLRDPKVVLALMMKRSDVL